MLPIYICEDNENQLAHLKKIISDIIMIEDMDASIVCVTFSPYQLLSYLSEHRTPSLYFLDVNLNTAMDGFSLAQEIRKHDPRGFIVFITAYDELSHLAFKYKVEAMDYILKSSREELSSRMRECILKALELYTLPTNTVQKAIALKIDGRIISIKLSDIYCIETSAEAHKIRIYKRNGYTELFYSLKNIVKLLDESFFQCHKSCIINLTHVKEVNKKKCLVILENGKVCPVATRIVKALASELNMSLP
ncbi:MAG: response regulator transcription factor [Clostridiales bacterium]|nr:response regulator transcription factor [Clostridiales bacterium]